MFGTMARWILAGARFGVLEAGSGTMACDGTVSVEEALGAERARYAAQMANDFGTMEKLFGDDLVYIHSSTTVDSKASFIESMRSGAVRYRAMSMGDTKVRCYGALAIVTGAAAFEVTARGQDMTLNLLFHAAWAKRGKGLEFVSWQATRLPAKD